MKLKRFKERDHKRIGILIFTIVCILLVSGVVLYRTFAIFEVRTNQNVIKGTVQDPGNIYFAFYVDNNIQKEMPQQGSGYILDEENSYCGVTGENDSNIKVSLTEDWKIVVSGVTSSRTKCNLKFVRGAYILGKPVKAVTNGDGLYEITHTDVNGTINDDGFKESEWRYAGKDPNNYITFNEENWRIIGLVNVMTENNEVEQRVKIVKSESIGKYAWDSNNSNDWTKSSLIKELNEDYYNNKLKDNAKTMIEENIIWNIGGEESSYKLISEYYQFERGTKTYNNQAHIWNTSNTLDGIIFHSIGLIYPSDYGYAISDDNSETTRKECLSKPLYSWQYNTECGNNDFITPSETSMWALTPSSLLENYAFRISEFGYVSIPDGLSVTSKFKVYPTLYLKSTVKIQNDDQDGSESNPYHLKLIE